MSDELAISYSVPEAFVSLAKANDEDVLTLSIPDLMQTLVVVQIVVRVGEKTFLDGRNSCNILWAIKSFLEVADGMTERFRFQDDDRALFFKRGPANIWKVSTSEWFDPYLEATCDYAGGVEAMFGAANSMLQAVYSLFPEMRSHVGLQAMINGFSNAAGSK